MDKLEVKVKSMTKDYSMGYFRMKICRNLVLEKVRSFLCKLFCNIVMALYAVVIN